MKSLFLSILLAVTLAGCVAHTSPFKYAELGSEPVAIGTTYKATPSEPWLGATSDLIEEYRVGWSAAKTPGAWLSFTFDRKDGDALYEYVDPDFPLFRSDMSSAEIMEFHKRSLEFRQLRNVETSNLRPAPFGAVTGFRFEYSYLRSDGSSARGTMLGAVVDERLQLISYSASSEDFDLFLEDANRVMQSVQLQ